MQTDSYTLMTDLGAGMEPVPGFESKPLLFIKGAMAMLEATGPHLGVRYAVIHSSDAHWSTGRRIPAGLAYEEI